MSMFSHRHGISCNVNVVSCVDVFVLATCAWSQCLLGGRDNTAQRYGFCLGQCEGPDRILETSFTKHNIAG